VLQDLLRKSGVIIINNNQGEENEEIDTSKAFSQLDFSQSNQEQLEMLQQWVEDAL
jgi:tRNA/tmRNA/rRNA uracil-C5-methylase (TrmA/RlmC/RlmD family)